MPFFRIRVIALAHLRKSNQITSKFFGQQDRCLDNRMRVQLAECQKNVNIKMIGILKTYLQMYIFIHKKK